MYVPEGEYDAGRLLQGDVVTDIQLVGALNLRGIQHHTPAHGEGPPPAWTVPQVPKMGSAMVLSHSCEVADENGVKLTSIILAPIRDLNHATAPDRIDELIASNQIGPGVEWSYLKYFYLEPSPRIPFPAGSVVDFSKLFSVRKQAFRFVLERKVLQLQDAVRESMALKLALYFHRSDQGQAA